MPLFIEYKNNKDNTKWDIRKGHFKKFTHFKYRSDCNLGETKEETWTIFVGGGSIFCFQDCNVDNCVGFVSYVLLIIYSGMPRVTTRTRKGQ